MLLNSGLCCYSCYLEISKYTVVHTDIDLTPMLKFSQSKNLYAISNVTKGRFDHWVGKLHDAVLLQMISKVKGVHHATQKCTDGFLNSERC